MVLGRRPLFLFSAHGHVTLCFVSESFDLAPVLDMGRLCEARNGAMQRSRKQPKAGEEKAKAISKQWGGLRSGG